MKDQDTRTIYLLVDRQERAVSVGNILYVMMTDKLCSIYLAQGQPIRIFLTLANLISMLPKDDFIQISRSCLVAVPYIRNVTDRAVIMADGSELHYTARKKPDILSAFQQSLIERARRHEAIAWKLDFATEFGCFDYCPFPFIILEIVTETAKSEPGFICRYANEAMAALRKTPLQKLMNARLRPSLSFHEDRYMMYFADVAYNGSTRSWPAYHKDAQAQMHIFCYQPHYGYCACLIMKM